MTAKHDNFPPQPEQIDLMFNNPTSPTEKIPVPTLTPDEMKTSPGERQTTLPIKEVGTEKSIEERTRQIQGLLETGGQTILSLYTADQRNADEGEYDKSFSVPFDELRIIEPNITLTNQGERGPVLLILAPPRTTHKKGRPVLQPPELYFCPNGIDGHVQANKIKPGTTKDQFIKQWNA